MSITYDILGLVILQPSPCKCKRKQKLQARLSRNFDFVSTILVKNEAELT